MVYPYPPDTQTPKFETMKNKIAALDTPKNLLAVELLKYTDR